MQKRVKEKKEVLALLRIVTLQILYGYFRTMRFLKKFPSFNDVILLNSK